MEPTVTTSEALTDAERWEAVLNRDRRYDGQFVSAIRTTRVYCRPSCPARHPHRHNITFYADPREAEQAGYRPCKRCRPNDVAADAELVAQVCRYIDEHLDEKITLEVLSEHVHYSPFHLQRVFKRALGVSPRQYAEAARLDCLRSGLRRGDSVTRAATDAGLSPSTLYPADNALLGMNPRTYRRGARGVQISYTIVDSALGRLLVAATSCGVCGVSLGDDDAALEAFLRAEYPSAELRRDDAALQPWVSAILDRVAGEPSSAEVPVDVQATAFQWRVYNALRAIPVGETRTYTQIAQAIGAPKAVRAVARACATNRVAVVIPCHRVIREDGSLAGYRWGLDRKAELLDREKVASQAR